MKSVLSPTRTSISKIGTTLSIFTEYVDGVKNIVAFISDIVKTVNFIVFKQGELGIINDGYNEVQFSLNSKGELIVIGENTSRFNIDEDGNLTITE